MLYRNETENWFNAFIQKYSKVLGNILKHEIISIDFNGRLKIPNNYGFWPLTSRQNVGKYNVPGRNEFFKKIFKKSFYPWTPFHDPPWACGSTWAPWTWLSRWCRSRQWSPRDRGNSTRDPLRTPRSLSEGCRPFWNE